MAVTALALFDQFSGTDSVGLCGWVWIPRFGCIVSPQTSGSVRGPYDEVAYRSNGTQVAAADLRYGAHILQYTAVGVELQEVHRMVGGAIDHAVGAFSQARYACTATIIFELYAAGFTCSRVLHRQPLVRHGIGCQLSAIGKGTCRLSPSDVVHATTGGSLGARLKWSGVAFIQNEMHACGRSVYLAIFCGYYNPAAGNTFVFRNQQTLFTGFRIVSHDIAAGGTDTAVHPSRVVNRY